MWIFPLIRLSWNSYSVWDKLVWLNWFWQFLYEVLSSFKLKGFYYLYTWSFSLCEWKTSFCTGLISRKLGRFLLLFSTGFFFTQCLTSFSCINHLLHFCTWFFILLHLTQIRFSWLILLLISVIVFGDSDVYHKDWLTYSCGGTYRPDELCYNFSISNDLTQIFNPPTWIPDCDSHSPVLLDFFFDTSICSTIAFTP